MSLSKSAMLVSANIVNGGLLGERRDTQASELVESTFNVAYRRTKASKFLIDRKHKAVKRVVAASQRVREVVYRFTMPWGDDKSRLLPVRLTDDFKRNLKKAIYELEAARDDYVIQYPALVAASECDLGGLFDRSQYPPPSKVRDMFKTRVAYWPIPEAGHFVAEIEQEAADEARKLIESEIEQRLLDATYDMVKRAKEVVTTFIDKVEAFRQDGSGNSISTFRDSLVDNVRDTAYLIERMNLTNNPEINKVVSDLKRLGGFTAFHLRKLPDLRQKALTAGQQILANLTMLDLKDQEVSSMVAGAGDYMDM